MTEDLKGDLEVIVNYLDNGLLKTRVKDVKDAELPVVLRDIFIALMKTLLETKYGKIPDNAMPVFSNEQFKEI